MASFQRLARNRLLLARNRTLSEPLGFLHWPSASSEKVTSLDWRNFQTRKVLLSYLKDQASNSKTVPTKSQISRLRPWPEKLTMISTSTLGILQDRTKEKSSILMPRLPPRYSLKEARKMSITLISRVRWRCKALFRPQKSRKTCETPRKVSCTKGALPRVKTTTWLQTSLRQISGIPWKMQGSKVSKKNTLHPWKLFCSKIATLKAKRIPLDLHPSDRLSLGTCSIQTLWVKICSNRPNKLLKRRKTGKFSRLRAKSTKNSPIVWFKTCSSRQKFNLQKVMHTLSPSQRFSDIRKLPGCRRLDPPWASKSLQVLLDQITTCTILWENRCKRLQEVVCKWIWRVKFLMPMRVVKGI